MIKKLKLFLLVVYILIEINLDMSKLACPKLVYQCQKKPVSTQDSMISCGIFLEKVEYLIRIFYYLYNSNFTMLALPCWLEVLFLGHLYLTVFIFNCLS